LPIQIFSLFRVADSDLFSFQGCRFRTGGNIFNIELLIKKGQKIRIQNVFSVPDPDLTKSFGFFRICNTF
jgi:hypothetical protein